MRIPASVQRLVPRIHALLQDSRWREYGLGNLCQPRDLVVGGAGRFHATTDDPSFRLGAVFGLASKGWKLVVPVLLRPGYYRISMGMCLPHRREDAVHGNARFYLDSGEGASEAEGMGLPFRNGEPAQRLIRVERKSWLRIDPLEFQGNGILKSFRVQFVPEHEAWTEMNRAVGKAPAVPGKSESGGAPDPEEAEGLELLWNLYNRLYERPVEETLSYARWIAEVEPGVLAGLSEMDSFVGSVGGDPLCSVIVTAGAFGLEELERLLRTLQGQRRVDWELCVVTAPSPWQDRPLPPTLQDESRLRWIPSPGHGSQELLQAGVDAARGRFVLFPDPGDRVSPFALLGLSVANLRCREAGIVYADHDVLDANGFRSEPFFKPDWSPDLFYSSNYLGRAVFLRRVKVLEAGGVGPGEGRDPVHDLLCRMLADVTEASDVAHIPHVLCHLARGATLAPDGSTARSTEDWQALEDLVRFEQRGAGVTVSQGGSGRVRWPMPDPTPRVSLIVPTRDGLDHLRRCVQSLRGRTRYRNFEILVVDNQSSSEETLAYLEQLRSEAVSVERAQIRVLSYDHPFNFSAINNMAAGEAEGDVLGFLNNDVEAVNPEWLDEIVAQTMRPAIGCVGARLLYPDGRIQHAGIVLGVGGLAAHPHRYADGNSPGYCGWLQMVRNVSAVTGAALFLRKELYDALGGMDEEELVVAYNDVDLCLKASAAGYRNLWTPFAEFVHHESASRGSDRSVANAKRLAREEAVMIKRWGNCLKSDPFYSANLSHAREDFTLDPDPGGR